MGQNCMNIEFNFTFLTSATRDEGKINVAHCKIEWNGGTWREDT
jgi:hypothetical protein